MNGSKERKKEREKKKERKKRERPSAAALPRSVNSAFSDLPGCPSSFSPSPRHLVGRRKAAKCCSASSSSPIPGNLGSTDS